MTTYTIHLNHKTPPLNANHRHHWRKKAKITKTLREEVFWKTKAHKIPPQQHITVTYHYQPKDNRRRDTDNLVPTLKVCCDGITDTGIIPDDTPQYMTKHMPIIHPAHKNKPAHCWLEITTNT